GVAYAPYSWLIFSIAYSDQWKIISRRFIVLTVFIPSFTILLALTTKWHGLIWSEYHIYQQAGFSALGVSHGLWFWVHFTYSYLLLLIGTILLARALWRRRGMYRGQIAAMLVAVLAPWIGNALYLTGNSPIPYLDLTPFAFTVTVVALAWAIFGFHLVDIAPLARDRVVDSMREGMIVLDVRGNIVDINNAASRMIGVPVVNAIGKTAADVFYPWSHLVERFRNVLEAKDEISVGQGAAQRRYEVRLSPLQDPQGQLVGRVIMLRAMDDEIPQPRFSARSEASSGNTQPIHGMDDNEETRNSLRTEKKATSIWGSLINYYFVPIKMDIPIPIGINPVWYRTRERIFTIFARIGAGVGLIAVVFVLRSFLNDVNLVFAALVAFLWMLGAARSVKYELRVIGFLALVYGLAFIETLNFGFSADSFAFFLGFTIVAAVLTSRRGAISALAVAFSSLSVFFVLLNSGAFIPLTIFLEGEKPPDVNISSLLVFVACALATTVAIVILLENLNASWQKEIQALNLLQQERDILERRVEQRTHDLAEASDSAVRISNELRKYYRAIEQSGNTIVITDIKGNIEYANPRFSQSTGYTLEEAKGKNPRILKSDKQPAEYYRQLWKTISEGNIWTGEFFNKRKDGSLYWESATIAPVLDQNGTITNYVAVKEDITARRQAEEQLRKLSQAVEQSGNTVIVMDKNGLIEYINPKFTEVTGYSAEDALGKSPISLMNGLKGDPDFSQDEWWKMVNAGHIWHGEFQNHRKDGSVFWESATIAPVHNRDGEAINFVEIKQDITEQKILQDQLQKQNDYLSILHQISLDLLNRRELHDLLQVVVDRSAVLLDAPFSQLTLEEDGVLVVAAATDNLPNVKGDRITREHAKLSWQAFDTHQPAVLENYSTWEHRDEKYAALLAYAIIEIPVMAGERCLGILTLGRSQPNYRFTTEQIETGILFARLVALVLDNANLYDSAVQEIAERERTQDSLQRSHQQQQVINSLLKISLEDKSMDEVLEAILDEFLSIEWLTISPRGGFFLLNEQTNMLDLRAHRNLAPDLQVKCSQIALGQCLCGRAALSRQIQFADCLDDRHEIRYEGIQEHGHYNIPILQGGKVLGVIVLYLSHGYQKTEDD
ncbi:MAG: PAS domain S-box protein, partial [Anaerolineales bacterium]|nr:PAS domain S-box protein [Anaerolineales bacterium]